MKPPPAPQLQKQQQTNTRQPQLQKRTNENLSRAKNATDRIIITEYHHLPLPTGTPAPNPTGNDFTFFLANLGLSPSPLLPPTACAYSGNLNGRKALCLGLVTTDPVLDPGVGGGLRHALDLFLSAHARVAADTCPTPPPDDDDAELRLMPEPVVVEDG